MFLIGWSTILKDQMVFFLQSPFGFCGNLGMQLFFMISYGTFGRLLVKSNLFLLTSWRRLTIQDNTNNVNKSDGKHQPFLPPKLTLMETHLEIQEEWILEACLGIIWETRSLASMGRVALQLVFGLSYSLFFMLLTKLKGKDFVLFYVIQTLWWPWNWLRVAWITFFHFFLWLMQLGSYCSYLGASTCSIHCMKLIHVLTSLLNMVSVMMFHFKIGHNAPSVGFFNVVWYHRGVAFEAVILFCISFFSFINFFLQSFPMHFNFF